MQLKLKDYIFLSIIIVLLVLALFKRSNVETILQPIEDTRKIDSLISINKIKSDSIKELSITVDTLNNQYEKSKKEIAERNLTIKKIKNAANKKDSVISFYNVNELELFFSKRYDTTNR